MPSSTRESGPLTFFEAQICSSLVPGDEKLAGSIALKPQQQGEGDGELNSYWPLGLVFHSREHNSNRNSPVEKDWFHLLTNIEEWRLVNRPAVIKAVARGGPAAACNLLEGDIVVSVDGHPATSANVLSLLQTHRRDQAESGNGASKRDVLVNDGKAGTAGSSLLMVMRGNEKIEVEVVRTSAENVRRTEHVSAPNVA